MTLPPGVPAFRTAARGAHRRGAGWYVLGAAALLGGAGLIREGARRGWRYPLRHGVLGGFSAGVGLALLALLEARRAARTAAPEPSFPRRVIASIPFRGRNGTGA
jgi:hypothetical protein